MSLHEALSQPGLFGRSAPTFKEPWGRRNFIKQYKNSGSLSVKKSLLGLRIDLDFIAFEASQSIRIACKQTRRVLAK